MSEREGGRKVKREREERRKRDKRKKIQIVY